MPLPSPRILGSWRLGSSGSLLHGARAWTAQCFAKRMHTCDPCPCTNHAPRIRIRHCASHLLSPQRRKLVKGQDQLPFDCAWIWSWTSLLALLRRCRLLLDTAGILWRLKLGAGSGGQRGNGRAAGRRAENYLLPRTLGCIVIDSHHLQSQHKLMMLSASTVSLNSSCGLLCFWFVLVQLHVTACPQDTLVRVLHFMF